MTKWEATINHVAVLAVSLSGIAYGVFKYWIPSPDPDSAAGHPLQAYLLKLHLLAAPLLIFAIGLIFRRHALARNSANDPKGRRSGRSILYLLGPLVLSGILVQCFVDDSARRWSGWIHAGVGALFFVGWLLHPKPREEPEPGLEAETPVFEGTDE